MGFVVKGVKKLVKGVVGIAGKVVGTVFGYLVGGKVKNSGAKSSIGRLNKTLNPEDFRKIVFGKTASALDLRYWEVYGTNGTSYDEVIAMACHQINAVKEFYVEEALAIDASNGVQTNYSGVLTRAFKLGAPAQTALSVGGGSQWTSAATMTGVPHMVLKWTKNDTKLPNGPPSRYTNIIEGALVYDPRRDSTQPGGSGSHRINDQTTWAYSTLDSNSVPIGRNNALQALWYLLGWRVQNPTTGEMVLVAGRGLDPNDINIQSFITGANNCETAGFYTDMILSTEDEHTSNEDKITADGLIAQLIDPGGLWSYYANVDDTATIAVYLTDDDILDTGKVSWNEYRPMSEQYNQVVGKFIDPSATALFQPRAYPIVRDATYESNLGVKRRKSIDFEQIQDALLAQKLARLSLNQGQYQAEFSANFSYRAIKAQAWSIVSYTSERFGWTKLFRVYRQSISANGIGMTLREVHPSIWTPGSVVTPPSVPLGSKYDPTQQITLAGLASAAYSGTGSDGAIRDGLTLSWSTPVANVGRTEVQLKLTTDTYWQSFGPFKADIIAIGIFPLLSGSVYNVRARHVSTNEVAGPWVNLIGNFTVGTTTNVGLGDISNGNITIGSDGKISGIGTANIFVDNGKTQLQGLLSARPASGAFVNQSYLATDTKEEYLWNGSSWIIATDLTSKAQVTIEALDAKVINADYTGTIASGLLPVNITQPKVVRGGVDITTNNMTTYSLQNLAGGCIGNTTVNNTTGSSSKGIVTIGTGFNATGSYELVVTVDGLAYPARKVTVSKVNGEPPSGGSGSTSGSFDPTGYSTSSTSFTEVGRVSNLTVASGKVLNGYLSADYLLSATVDATRALSAKWQYSVAGANSWTDIAGTVNGSDATFEVLTFDQTAGSITCNQSKTGLSAGNYDIRCLAALNSSGSSAVLNITTGSASATVT